MGFSKYAKAQLTNPVISQVGWDDIRAKAFSPSPSFEMRRAAQVVLQQYDPSEYLLSHCTIIASVDTESPGMPTGSQMFDGTQINRQYPDFYVTADTAKYINNNQDCWERKLLLSSFRTFIGGENYVEHIQIPELSKGKIIDAAARDIGDSVYVDILIATDRKHKPLIEAITSGQLSTLSMGCHVSFTQCTKCGNVAEDETQLCFTPSTRILKSTGTYVPISEIVVGDQVITHTGATKPVTEVMRRSYSGSVTCLEVSGVPTRIRSTPEHPFWALRYKSECSCGCGLPLVRTVEHERGSIKSFQRRFLPGHSTRVRNPNPLAPTNLVELSPTFEVDLEFVEASHLRVGDYLTFPIPQGEFVTADATVNKARLIGYFLAEGSYSKNDQGDRVGVEFSFGHHEYHTLASEVLSLLAIEFGKTFEYPETWRSLVECGGIRPIKRRTTSRQVDSDVRCPHCGAPSEYAFNARFNPKRDDCYTCKVCKHNWNQGANREVLPHIYSCPVNGEPGTGSTVVRIRTREAADFFFKYCGEYSHEKKVHPDVMQWPSEIQGHVFRCWLGGDGTQNNDGVRGNTSSFSLLSQMHVLAARCGLYTRKSIVFGGHSAQLDQVVNGSGVAFARDDRGWLPSFALTVPEPVGFSGEARFTDRETARITLSGLTSSFKRIGNWLIYRIKSITTEYYQGDVYNFEVADDHSYVAEGLAVHNCRHIKYEKGNWFLDAKGQRRKIAELCGHITKEPGSVKFIEGSWVAHPAFAGAVLRTILDPKTAELAEHARQKIQVAFSRPHEVFDPNSMQKAARLAPIGVGAKAIPADHLAYLFDGPSLGSLRVPPPFSGSSKAAEAHEARLQQIQSAQEQDFPGQSEMTGAPPAADPDTDSKEPFKKVINDLYESVVDEVTRKVRNDISQKDKGDSVLDENRSNESLIRSALRYSKWRERSRMVEANVKDPTTAKTILAGLILHDVGGWEAVAKAKRFSGCEVLVMNRLLERNTKKSSMAGEVRIYRTVIAVGGTAPYSDVNSYLTACREVMGRTLTNSEMVQLVEKGKLFCLGTR